MAYETQLAERPGPGGGAVAREHDPASPVRVLLIEDNPGDARLIEYMLAEVEDGVFTIERVDRLEAGVRRLGRGGIGLVLLDLTLPDSQGLQTFLELQARAPSLPMIVLSGMNDTNLAVQAVQLGAQDYLVKGQVDAALLFRAMRYAMERKRMTLQLGRYAEELRNKNAQLEADFNMAREIQQIFLPSQYPTFPQWVAPEESAIRFSHRYRPAAAVGGDFFDIFPITSSTAGVFICDVMGHGMRAALVTAIMRGLVEELMPVAADAGRFLTEINRSLHAILRRTREPFMATACYLVADVGSNQLRFANAGHPSPLRIRGDKVEPLRMFDPRHGPALGLFDRADYPTGLLPIAPDDRWLLFTDGLYEVENSTGEEYGPDRLIESVRHRARQPTTQLLDEIVLAAQNFSASADFEDDVCLVGVEIVRVGISA